jgi:hypothetical protein
MRFLLRCENGRPQSGAGIPPAVFLRPSSLAKPQAKRPRYEVWTEIQNRIKVWHMKRTPAIVLLSSFAFVMAMLATLPVAGQGNAPKPAGKLVLFSDLAVFAPGPKTEICTVRNRFKKGEFVGFRLFVVDGGTSQAEESAAVVVHISLGGKTFDLPALYRGIPHQGENGAPMPIHAGMWTAKWKVPDDAPTGTVHYSASASDKYGRAAEWTPQGGEPSFLTIVQ